MDILTQIYRYYVDQTAAMSPVLEGTILRTAGTLVLCTLFCALSFWGVAIRVPRAVALPLQWLVCGTGLFTALEIPIGHIRLTPEPRAWLMAFAYLCLLVMPWGLSFLLVHRAALRRRVAGALYASILLLLTLALIQPRLCSPKSRTLWLDGSSTVSRRPAPPSLRPEPEDHPSPHSLTQDYLPQENHLALSTARPRRACSYWKCPQLASSRGASSCRLAMTDPSLTLLRNGCSPSMGKSSPEPRSFSWTAMPTLVVQRTYRVCVLHAADMYFVADPASFAGGLSATVAPQITLLSHHHLCGFVPPATARPLISTTIGQASHQANPRTKTMMPRKPKPARRDDLAEKLEELEFLARNGVNMGAILSAKMADRDGLDLPGLTFQHARTTALLNSVRPYHPPAVSADEAIMIGDVPVQRDDLPSGVLIAGGTGSGKTTLELQLIDQERRRNSLIHFYDPKGESRRFPFYWDDAVTFTPREMPMQLLEPPKGCDPLTYFIGAISELRTEFEIRNETFPLAYGIYDRIVRGMRPGDPFPSISDFRRVLEHEAEEQKRDNLMTLARVFMGLEIVLGPNARARRVPELDKRFRVIGYDFVGHDVKIQKLILGFHFHKMILQAYHEEHTTGLRSISIIDEAAPLCSLELTPHGASGLSSLKRFATQARFTGTALILGTQNISQLDPAMKNAGTLVVLRAPSVDDAEDAAKMLGLPRDAAPELMRLKVGEGYLRGVGWPQPVKIQVPPFPS